MSLTLARICPFPISPFPNQLAPSSANHLSLQVIDWEKVVAEEQEEKLDISADMIRQYKTMQSTMALRIHLLESNLSHLQVELHPHLIAHYIT